MPFPSPMKVKKVKSESHVAQSCPTLSNPMDCGPPGSSVRGILQARALEWVPLPSPFRAHHTALFRQLWARGAQQSSTALSLCTTDFSEQCPFSLSPKLPEATVPFSVPKSLTISAYFHSENKPVYVVHASSSHWLQYKSKTNTQGSILTSIQ